MYERRKTRITWEGMSFLAILAFIVLGSILRQINLLVLLSGLMIAPFFFNWRICRKMLQSVVFRRRLPQWAHAGDDVQVEWEMENNRHSIPSWEVRVTDSINGNFAGEEVSRTAQVIIHQVGPGGRGRARYRCRFPHRGIAWFGPSVASSAFPVGLVRTRMRVTETARLVVAPATGTLSPRWHRLTSSSHEASDSADGRRRGSSSDEFFSLRAWQHGDNPRMVHWRSSAKRGELLVRQGVDPVSARFNILVDLAAHDDATAGERLLGMAATIISGSSGWQRHGARACMAVCGCDATPWPLVIGPAGTLTLLECLATVRPASNTGVLEMIARCRGKTSDRVIVLSNRAREQANADEAVPVTQVRAATHVQWIDVATDNSWFAPATPPDEFGSTIARPTASSS